MIAHRTAPVALMGAAMLLLSMLAMLATTDEALATSNAATPQHAAAAALFDYDTHACVVVGDGDVRCWGDNEWGQLGQGNVNDIGDDELPDSIPPVDLGPGVKAKAVSTGGFHTCALLTTGDVKCWGRNNFGQLGIGSTANVGDNEVPSSSPNVDLGTGRTAIQINVGGGHSCALLDDATIRCWGLNDMGGLGLGHMSNIGDNESPASQPVVDLGPGRTAVQIGVAERHMCAILDTGELRCWGRNDWGQLGLGHTNRIGDNELPSTVPVVDLGPGRTAVAVAGAYSHTCVILDTGDVRCFGRGENGVPGQANVQNIGDDELPSSIPVIDIGTGRTAVSVVTGTRHACVILDNRTMRCWGAGSNGRLGLGNTQQIGDNEVPGSMPTIDFGPERYPVAIGAGNFSVCALLDDGNVRCWGANDSGRLGLGHLTQIGDNESILSVPVISVGGYPNPMIAEPTGATGPGTLDSSIECRGEFWFAHSKVYAWLRNGQSIPGSDPTRTVDRSDDAALIRCGVTASNPDGAVSATLDGVVAASTPPTAPVIASSTHQVGEWSNVADIGLTWSGAVDAHGIAGYSIGAGVENLAAGSSVTHAASSGTVTVEDGEVWLHARAVDGTSSWGDAHSAGPYRIDTVAPTSSIRGDVEAGASTYRISVDASDGLSGLSATAYSLDGGSWQSGAEFSVVPPVLRSQRYTIRVRDRAGNIAVTTHDASLPDVTPPVIAARTILRREQAVRGRRYRFQASDNSGRVSSVRASFRIGGVTRQLGANRSSVDLAGAPEGRGHLTVTAMDSSGNASDMVIPMIIDRSAPTVSTRVRETTRTRVWARIDDDLSGVDAPRRRVRVPALGRNKVRVRVRDSSGNAATRTVSVRRLISLAHPEHNAGSERVFGFRANRFDVDAAFKFHGYVAPWYKPPASTRGIVTEAQRRLTMAGYPTARTGRLDLPTIMSIKRFQRARGIPAIATIGPQTRRALDAIIDERGIR